MRKRYCIVRNLIILLMVIVCTYLGFSQTMRFIVPGLFKQDAQNKTDLNKKTIKSAELAKENTISKQPDNKVNNTGNDNKVVKAEIPSIAPKSTPDAQKKTPKEKPALTPVPSVQSSTWINADNEQNNNNRAIPYDKLISMKNISFKEKLSIVAITSKIKKSSMDKIWNIAKDGVTDEDIDEVKSILKEDLSEKDINKLMKLVNKNIDLYAQGKLE